MSRICHGLVEDYKRGTTPDAISLTSFNPLCILSGEVSLKNDQWHCYFLLFIATCLILATPSSEI